MSRVYLLFQSTHETLKAESVLQAAGISGKVVTKPAAIKVDCGLALRVAGPDREQAEAAVAEAGLRLRGTWDV